MQDNFFYKLKKFLNKNNIYLLILPFVCLYSELLLKALSKQQFTFTNIAGTFFCSIALGIIYDLLCSISKSVKLNQRLALIFTELIVAASMVEFFLNDTFNSYMSVSAIFNSSEGVVGQFSDVMVTIALHGIPVILLFELPAIVFLIFMFIKKGKYLNYQKRTSLTMSCGLMLFFICECLCFIFLLGNSNTKENITSQYSFDKVTKTVNLQVAVKSDVFYLLLNNPFKVELKSEDDFDEESSSINYDDWSSEPSGDEYGYNVMDIDFDSLTNGNNDPKIDTVHNYVKNLIPSKKNEYTGMFEGKNLIILSLESFTKEVIDEERTPAMYRLLTEGIIFEDYYQPFWGGSTATGEMAYVTGIIPTNGVTSYYDTIDKNLYFTMGNRLMGKDYNSLAFHDGYYDYYQRYIVHPNFGYSDFIAKGSGLDGMLGEWPESDLEMMKLTKDYYIDNAPFNVYYMTISGHCDYTEYGNYFANKYMHSDVLKDLDCSDILKGYYGGNLETEYALEYLLGQLEEKGIMDDTVIVMTGDHYPYGLLESFAWGTEENCLAELYGFEPETHPEYDHNALIIWSGSLEKEDEKIVVKDPVYSVDVLPTLLNLFGIEYDSRLLPGRDALSDTEGLVIWPDYSWLTSEGYYDAETDEFTPAPGHDADAEYIAHMNNKVANKINYSADILQYDYFNILFGDDE